MSKVCCGITYSDRETTCKFCGKPLVSPSELSVDDFLEDDSEAGTSVLTSNMTGPGDLDDSEAGTSVLTNNMMGPGPESEMGTTVLTAGALNGPIDESEMGTTVLSARSNGLVGDGRYNNMLNTGTQPEKNKISTGALVGIIVGAAVVVIGLVVALIFILK